ncbi:putative membrane protein [Clostridium sp. CAG:433]|jgi:uncharacterized membrane protein|nr:putative membrane protein [Clostridium sp. CAG:433]
MYKDYLEKNHSFDKKTMIGIFCMIIVIGGVFGFLYEYFFYFFNGGMKEFYYRGGNFLPWINIYATGSVMIYILTYKYRKNPLKVFLISVISTGLLEYFSGLGIYIIGDGLRYWDYNTEILNFGNINGFVCLRSVMFFGLSALLLMYVIVPFCFHVANKSNKKVFLIVTISICSIFLADEFYNLIFTKLFNLPKATTIYKSIGIHYM